LTAVFSFVARDAKAVTFTCKRWGFLSIKCQRERTTSVFLEGGAKIPPGLAYQIEECLYAFHDSSIGKTYREHARKLLANLSNKKNTLRERLVAGDIAAYDLVRMNDDALASTEKAKLREEMRQNGLAIAKAPRVRAMAGCELSEMYMCPECGHEKTQIAMLRRKMAVDRFRILARCLSCNNRWEA